MQIYEEVEQNSETPDASWSLDRLAGVIEEEQGEIKSHARKMAVHSWRLGRALTLAKEKCKKTWGIFLQNVGVSIATDNRARRLFGYFDEDSLDGLTIMEAYQQAGISKHKEEETEEPSGDLEEEDTDTIDEDDADESESDESEEDDPPNEDGGTIPAPVIRKTSSKPTAAKSPPSPPKEDPSDFGRLLAQLVNMARLLAEKVQTLDSTDQETLHWSGLIEELRTQVDAIENGLSHE